MKYLFFFVIIFSSVLNAEDVYLKNKNKITNAKVTITASDITIESNKASYVVERSAIDSIINTPYRDSEQTHFYDFNLRTEYIGQVSDMNVFFFGELNKSVIKTETGTIDFSNYVNPYAGIENQLANINKGEWIRWAIGMLAAALIFFSVK